ncbi:DUF2513 domain-containing protein [Cupriavidus sp. CP313]
MKRDWDTIRDVLLEVEELDAAKFADRQYGPVARCDDPVKAMHAVLLWKAGYIEGADASSMDGGDSVVAFGLTWDGHDLLDTIRSKAVWERIKDVAKNKGIELTFEAVKTIGKSALDWVLNC